MIIAMPVEEQSLQSKICPSFGRTPFFLIYDIASREHSFLPNSAAESESGAGIKAAQLVLDSGVGALLTPRCGENAGELLKEAEIKIFKTTQETAQDNLYAFKGGGLPLLTEFHAG
ncbi:MAG: NifB/NifX family molybdenum-iron cluster-binding protein, partial [Oscillospiraceae bacterium]